MTDERSRLVLNKISRLQPDPPAMRYEHNRPGEVFIFIHLDIKTLERIEVVGHCITGDRFQRKRGAGRSICTGA
jgi:hypothetical protein